LDEKIVSGFVEIPKQESGEISKAIATAKGIEKRAKAFYEENAKKASNAELKDALEFIAKEEQQHLEILLAVEESLKRNGRLAIVEESVLQNLKKPKIYPGKGTETKKFLEKNELTVLLWAMRAERKAEAFYRKQAERTGVSEAKGFFNALAEFEVRHFEFLDGIFSTWTNTDDFILG